MMFGRGFELLRPFYCGKKSQNGVLRRPEGVLRVLRRSVGGCFFSISKPCFSQVVCVLGFRYFCI